MATVEYKYWITIDFKDNTKFEDVVDLQKLKHIIENIKNQHIKSVRYYNINLKIKNNV